MSGVGHLKTISLAKQNGYKVVIVYTFVDSPSDCLARIQSRVQNGGHPVPDEDVIRRFYRSKYNFWNKYAPLADHWVLYYNGGTEISLTAAKKGNDEVEIISENLYTTFKRNL